MRNSYRIKWRVSGSGTRDSNADQREVITRVNLLITQKQFVVSVAVVSEALESGGVAQAQGLQSWQVAWVQAQGLLPEVRQNRLSRGFKTREQVQVRLALSHYDWFNDLAGSGRLTMIIRVCWLPVPPQKNVIMRLHNSMHNQPKSA